eukprot:349867-Chlamydomonas_euryale.AAC.2
MTVGDVVRHDHEYRNGGGQSACSDFPHCAEYGRCLLCGGGGGGTGRGQQGGWCSSRNCTAQEDGRCANPRMPAWSGVPRVMAGRGKVGCAQVSNSCTCSNPEALPAPN